MDGMKKGERRKTKTKETRNKGQKIRIPSSEGQGVGSLDIQETIKRRK